MGQEAGCSCLAALLGLCAISSGVRPSSSYVVTVRHKHSVVDRQYVTFCASFASREHIFLFLDHPVSVVRECEEVMATTPGRCASAEPLVPPDRHVLLNELAAGSVRPLRPAAAHAVKMRGDAGLTGRGAIEAQAPQRRRRVRGACLLILSRRRSTSDMDGLDGRVRVIECSVLRRRAAASSASSRRRSASRTMPRRGRRSGGRPGAGASSAQRSTCLVSTRTAANSHNRSLAAAKLKSEAASPTIRSTPGDSDVACIPRARSRGHTPVRQASQW